MRWFLHRGGGSCYGKQEQRSKKKKKGGGKKQGWSVKEKKNREGEKRSASNPTVLKKSTRELKG